MLECILATSNKGKVSELKDLLKPINSTPQQQLGIRDVEETGLSFVENALIKARHACYWGQKPSLADDSGLVVPALQGEPGIYSARFAGPHATNDDNISYLLTRIHHIPPEQRYAYFYCVLVLMQHHKDPAPIITSGRLEGRIVTKAAGKFGFGYDPVFYLDDHHCTLAELSRDIKNQISHRAQALNLLKFQLEITRIYN